MRAYWASVVLHCLVLVVNGLPSRILLGAQEPAEAPSKFEKAGCNNFTNQHWQPLRPGYHITAPYGWLNDPHGGLQRNGITHLFFQYNPKALQWGAPFWAHVVSQNLAHWTWLPPALLPDKPYDQGGVWSGSTTVQDGDIPTITYTAAGTHVPELGTFFQQQAMATPVDLQDPLLKQWRKSDRNPFLTQVPPGGTNFQFRDPSEARDAVWKVLTSPSNPSPLPQHHYAVVVASQSFCMGGGSIYSAPNMTGPWSFVGTLFNQLAVDPQANGQCLALRRTTSNGLPSPAYGGPCDAFGPSCRMWEVVDFVELESGVFMIKWNDQSRFRGTFSLEWYVLGNTWDYMALIPVSNSTPGSEQQSGTAEASAADHTTSEHDAAQPRKSQGPVVLHHPRKFGDKPTPHSANSVGDSVTAKEDQQHGLPGSTVGQAYKNSESSNAFNRIEAGVVSATRSLFTGELDGQRFEPMRTDYGSVYASSVFPISDGRQLMFSWILETAAGCIDSCSDPIPEVHQQMGFKGALTLPRQLSYSKATRSMRVYPVPETAALRGRKVYNATAAAVATLPDITQLVPMTTLSMTNSKRATTEEAVRSNINTARQLEVQVNFTIQPPVVELNPDRAGSQSARQDSAESSSPESSAKYFAVGIRLHTSRTTFTDIFMNGTVVPQHHTGFTQLSSASASEQSRRHQHDPVLCITSMGIWVDRTHEGGATNTSAAAVEGGPVPLPVVDNDRQPWLLPDQQLQLSVWVDHSVLEVFAMGGLARVTSRIYPDEDAVAWGVSVWATPLRMSPHNTSFSDPSAHDTELKTSAVSGSLIGDEQMTASNVKESYKQGIMYRVYCWWCKLWFTASCGCRCGKQGANCGKENEAVDGASWRRAVGTGIGAQSKIVSEAAVANSNVAASGGGDGEWVVVVVADMQVWEINNAWLPPDC